MKLDIFAYHIGILSTEPPGSTFGLAYGPEDGPWCRRVEVKITTSRIDSEDRAWDQVTFNGVHVGNRSGARTSYAALCGPFIAPPGPLPSPLPREMREIEARGLAADSRMFEKVAVEEIA